MSHLKFSLENLYYFLKNKELIDKKRCLKIDDEDQLEINEANENEPPLSQLSRYTVT